MKELVRHLERTLLKYQQSLNCRVEDEFCSFDLVGLISFLTLSVKAVVPSSKKSQCDQCKD